jgi:DNA modification methylase
MKHQAKDFTLVHGDCIEEMAMSIEPQSMDMAVFSPPFPAIFAYTSSEADIGNSEDLKGEAKLHLSYFYRGLARVLKPGRIAIVHCKQIPRLKRTGEVGTFDFRGLNIRLGIRAGLNYDYDWLLTQNPQTEAIRTRSHALQFASMERDRAAMHGQFGDFLIKFIAPGVNKTPIDSEGQIRREEWIAWAESAWPWWGENGIRQTYTLNTKEAKGENDTKHICPLQLDTIDRAVRLYSNPGELVFSPFAGIGSEGYVSLKLGRKFYGVELKDEYYRAAIRNCERAIAEQSTEKQESLFTKAG